MDEPIKVRLCLKCREKKPVEDFLLEKEYYVRNTSNICSNCRCNKYKNFNLGLKKRIRSANRNWENMKGKPEL